MRMSHSLHFAPLSPDGANSERSWSTWTGSDIGLKWSSVCLEGREKSANSHEHFDHAQNNRESQPIYRFYFGATFPTFSPR